jgi:autotransporter-associated beta strand protein
MIGAATLTFATINLMPHASTPAKIVLASDALFSGMAASSATIGNGIGSGLSGFIDLAGATRSLNVANVATGVDLALNVPLTNGGIIKTGAGTLALNGVNTFTGATTVQAGRVELGGTLNGNVVVMNGGILALGAGTTGMRTVNGSLTVNAGGSFRVRVNGTIAGTDYDRLSLANAASTVTLAGTLDLVAGGTLPVGSSFRILENSASAAVNGAFTGLPQNAEFYEENQWWRISYTGGNGNDVVLTRIAPTPWQIWQLANFLADVNNAAIAGDFVDVDKDGIINRFEYAFGGNPNAAAAAPLVRVSITGGRLAVTFDRVVANTDITITVQGADNPDGTWTDLATSAAGAATTPLVGGATVTETGTGATRTVEVRDLYSIVDPLHPGRFLRVQVTRP